MKETRDRALFIIGLLILAIGIGTLVFGIFGIIETPSFSKYYKDYAVFIGVGAGLSVLGAGILIGSIVFKHKQ